MNKSYSKYNLSIKINAALIDGTIIVFWTGRTFDVCLESLWAGNMENVVGVYDIFCPTSEIISDADFYMARINSKEWPDESRIDAIGQNGNTGEHYK
tara:strand:- start:45 stop:335 length:291 start_codon:yes stop_codon:yes gene_type:complete